MQKQINTLLGMVFLTFFAIAANAQQAEEASVVIPETAHATVEYVSEDLLSMLDGSKEKFAEDPDAFYADIDAVISPWLDFSLWSKLVIGKTYYADTTEEQRLKFEEVFRTSLIQTYAKGLLNVEDTGFEVDPAHPGDEDKSSVPVTQTLYAGADRVKVIYTMAKNGEGRWQFRNVILEGINLGLTFRNQFARAAEEYGRDIDKVIANWSSEV